MSDLGLMQLMFMDEAQRMEALTAGRDEQGLVDLGHALGFGGIMDPNYAASGQPVGGITPTAQAYIQNAVGGMSQEDLVAKALESQFAQYLNPQFQQPQTPVAAPTQVAQVLPGAQAAIGQPGAGQPQPGAQPQVPTAAGAQPAAMPAIGMSTTGQSMPEGGGGQSGGGGGFFGNLMGGGFRGAMQGLDQGLMNFFGTPQLSQHQAAMRDATVDHYGGGGGRLGGWSRPSSLINAYGTEAFGHLSDPETGQIFGTTGTSPDHFIGEKQRESVVRHAVTGEPIKNSRTGEAIKKR